MKILPMLLVLAVAAVALIAVDQYMEPAPSVEGLNRFSSEAELKAYLKESSDYGVYNYGWAGTIATRGMDFTVAEGAPAPSAQSGQQADYSTTNIQVAGVDEADSVKNDGKYIYTIISDDYGRSRLAIIDAFPAESMGIVSEVELDEYGNAYATQLFVNKDRLMVFGSRQQTYYPSSILPPEPYYYTPKTFVRIYDISDRSNPVLLKNMTIDGFYYNSRNYNSRMIGDYAYIITNQPVYDFENPVIPLPAYECGPGETGPCFNAYYFDAPDYNNQFTIITAINLQDENEEETSKVFLMSYAQNLYVSQDNIYVTYSKRISPAEFAERYIDAIIGEVPSDVQSKLGEVKSSGVFSSSEKMSAFYRILQGHSATLEPEARLEFQKLIESRLQEVQEDIAKEMEKTAIQKISISGTDIEHTASGEVPGNVLNQFSMDEYEGRFRIATTTNSWQAKSKNHMYILDSSLDIEGSLEDLAEGERIYSVRFIGNRAYMVTFRQIDPLFVIDLSDSRKPEVLGFLKMPGVSDYLHPYDDSHVIGVGRDATEQGRILGLKLSLFDASDPGNPKEISRYIIGESGSSSEVINDHRAFLFDREKRLLAIPASVRERNAGSEKAVQIYPYVYTSRAYVFDISLEDGFVLKGAVEHEAGEDEYHEYYYMPANQIRRSLYIGDVLYTISDSMIKANVLEDLAEISSVSF